MTTASLHHCRTRHGHRRRRGTGRRRADAVCCSCAAPRLPIGAFAYSQGLEQAVAAGWVTRRSDGERVGAGPAAPRPGALDLPVLERLMDAWRATTTRASRAGPLAGRQPPDARAARRRSPAGRALARALGRLGVAERGRVVRPRRRHARVAMFALARRALAIPTPVALVGSRSRGRRARPARPCGWCRSGRPPASACCGGRRRDPGGVARARPRRRRAPASPRAGHRQRATRGPVFEAVPIMRAACDARNGHSPCASASPARSVRARPRCGCAVQAPARQLRHRRRHQRHLHQGGRAVPDQERRAAERAHRRRRDRRLPAHRDPRGRVDQPRRRRPVDARASPCSTSSSSRAAATTWPPPSAPSSPT